MFHHIDGFYKCQCGGVSISQLPQVMPPGGCFNPTTLPNYQYNFTRPSGLLLVHPRLILGIPHICYLSWYAWGDTKLVLSKSKTLNSGTTAVVLLFVVKRYWEKEALVTGDSGLVQSVKRGVGAALQEIQRGAWPVSCCISKQSHWEAFRATYRWSYETWITNLHQEHWNRRSKDTKLISLP